MNIRGKQAVAQKCRLTADGGDKQDTFVEQICSKMRLSCKIIALSSRKRLSHKIRQCHKKSSSFLGKISMVYSKLQYLIS